MRSFLISLTLCAFSFINLAQADAPKRILSIAGGNTEIIYALGGENLLVGSDTTSYYPEAAAKLPKVGYMRALSAEGVLSLDPDLIVLTEEAGPPPVIMQLKQAKVNILEVKAARSFDDIKENISVIGKAIEKEAEADKLIEKMNQQSDQLQLAISQQDVKKSYMFIFQHGNGSPMVAGRDTSADSIIALAGGKNVATAYEGFKPLTPEAAINMQPDIILVTNRGLASAGGLDAFKTLPGISLTNAAQQGNIIAMDVLFMLGFGPRTVEAATEIFKLQESM
ncbi:heme/hemin ABC transporter substrate-binding protein [Curvivirga sp.]|uniref:heme/hemin ABC transporter substrate-binding protein n=1 Tax=Curvivirga sp. TaxID=2856848 RepID=UPI003B5AD4FF